MRKRHIVFTRNLPHEAKKWVLMLVPSSCKEIGTTKLQQRKGDRLFRNIGDIVPIAFDENNLWKRTVATWRQRSEVCDCNVR